MTRALATVPNYHKYQLPPLEERTAPYRIAAHYLDWAAEHFPKQFTPWNIVARIVTGRSTTPKEASAEVHNLRKTATRVRRLLMQNYNRELENVPGVGVRATTGSLDVIKTSITARQRRFDAAAAGLQAAAGLVNVSEIPNNADTKPFKDWFMSKVQPNLRRLELLRGLLAAPVPAEDEKDLQ